MGHEEEAELHQLHLPTKFSSALSNLLHLVKFIGIWQGCLKAGYALISTVERGAYETGAFWRSRNERPGILDADGRIRDLSGYVADISETTLGDVGLAALRAIDVASLPLAREGVRLGPCVGGIGKILAVGRNYAEHARESGVEVLEEPILFDKATTSISGPNDPVMLPRGGDKTDWEVELGVVIGTVARYVDEEHALDHVAGYCVVNDVSERAFQLERGGQWMKGKSCDTFAPIGPWLVTRDEIPDPQALRLSTTVNGHRYQDGTTADMVFGAAYLVHYISQFMTLMPGDVIATGTPAGVGLGQKPPVYLKPGDVMELTVEGLGVQRQEVIAFDPARGRS
jgi:2,4-diketo-3-deoxy-L-fuconate hydrolase